MKNFQNKTTIWNQRKNFAHPSSFFEQRFCFLETSYEELLENRDRWHYLNVDELNKVAGKLANELQSDLQKIESARDKKAKGTPLDPDEEDLLKKQDDLERLQRILQIRQDPKFQKLTTLTTEELEKLSHQRSQRLMELWRKGKDVRTKEETQELAKIQAEVQVVQEILEERSLLTEAEAKILEEELKKDHISGMESTQAQVEELEKLEANAEDPRRQALGNWAQQMKYIRMIEDSSERFEFFLKRLQTGSLTKEDRREFKKLYLASAKVESKLSKVVDISKIMDSVDNEIRDWIIQIIQGLKEVRDKEHKVLLNMMKEDFELRIASIEEKWNNPNLHPDLEKEQATALTKLSELKTTLQKLQKLVELEPSKAEYQKLIKEIEGAEQTAKHREEQLKLLREKRKKFEDYVAVVNDRITHGFDGPEDPTTVATPNERELAEKYSIKYHRKRAEDWLTANGHSISDDWKTIAKANKDFQKLYNKHKELTERKARDKLLKRSLDCSLTNIDDRIAHLEANKDHVFFDEDAHYNMRLKVDEELQKFEELSEDKFEAAKSRLSADEEIPPWKNMRERFSGIYEKKRQLFDRGAPTAKQLLKNDDNPHKTASPYDQAVLEMEEIVNSGLTDKIRKVLHNPQLNLSDDKREEYLKNLETIEAAGPNIAGLKKHVDDMKFEEHAEIFKQDEQPTDPSFLRDLNQYLDKTSKFMKDTEKTISDTEKLLDNMKRFEFSAINQLTAYKPLGGGNTGGWASVHDIFKLGEMFYNWYIEDWNRWNKAKVGTLGSVVFDLPYLQSLANQSRLQVEQAESEAVNKHKESYDNMDAWAIEDAIPTLADADHLKAALLALADKGRVNFENVELWKKLMKFSGGVVSFDCAHPEKETDDIVRMEDKISRALISIYGDEDFFNDLKHKNESSLKTKMESFNDKAAQLASNPTGLQDASSLMLEQWVKYKEKGQKPPGFDPAEYEQYIRYGAEAGKMDPHAKFYYLMQGVVHGILPRSRLGAFSQDFAAVYPVMEFFDSHPPFPMVKEWAKIDGPKGDPPKFRPNVKYWAWYHGYLLQHPMVNERLRKIMSEGKTYDHDEIAAIVTGMADDNMNTLLRWRSSAGRFAETGLQNMACGMLFGMQVKAMQMNKYPKTAGRDMKRFLGAWIRFNAITGNLMFQDSDDYVRFGPENLQDTPRMGGAFVTTNRPTSEYIERMNKYIYELDPYLFGIISNRRKFSKKMPGFKDNMKAVVKHLRENYSAWNLFADRAEPSDPDALFNMMGDVIGAVVDKAAKEGRLKKMIEMVQNDIYQDDGSSDKKVFEALSDPPPIPYGPSDRASVIEMPVHRYGSGGGASSTPLAA